MEQQNNQQPIKRKIDWMGIICILLIIVSFSLFSYAFLVENVQKCVDDPINFSIYKIAEDKNISFKYATLNFYNSEKDSTPTNSYHISLETPPRYLDVKFNEQG